MNRRAFEVTVITVVLLQPVLGMVRLWARKTFLTTPPDSVSHKVADVATIYTG